MIESVDSRSLHVLAVEPFFGGSHRRFLEGILDHSRHRWTLVTGKPVHWKWRMRSAPLELAAATRSILASSDLPDVLFCTDMLDLPQWRGMFRNPDLLHVPTAIYYHENQWTYPLSPEARIDSHFGYTNLLSALAADACWFNSRFHREDFFQASRAFVQRMPDARSEHDFTRLERISQVIPPGFEPPQRLPSRSNNALLTLGWVSRWEHDKRPDRFAELLERLNQRGVDFQLVLLGPRSRSPADSWLRIRDRFHDRILYDGFAETSDDYWSHLATIDAVVSTADHEFFGIAICEAIWAGAVPVLPNRLSYPELAPKTCLYDSIEEAVLMITQLQSVDLRRERSSQCRAGIETLQMQHTVKQLDAAVGSVKCEV